MFVRYRFDSSLQLFNAGILFGRDTILEEWVLNAATANGAGSCALGNAKFHHPPDSIGHSMDDPAAISRHMLFQTIIADGFSIDELHENVGKHDSGGTTGFEGPIYSRDQNRTRIESKDLCPGLPQGDRRAIFNVGKGGSVDRVFKVVGERSMLFAEFNNLLLGWQAIEGCAGDICAGVHAGLKENAQRNRLHKYPRASEFETEVEK